MPCQQVETSASCLLSRYCVFDKNWGTFYSKWHIFTYSSLSEKLFKSSVSKYIK